MQRIGKNIFSLGASRVFTGILSFIAFVFLSRYLGAEAAGQYALVLAYYTIFSLLADLGVTRFVIKKVSEDKAAAAKLVGNFFIVQLFLSLAVLVIFIILPKVLNFDTTLTRAMFVAGIGLFAGSLCAPLSAVVQAHERITVVAGVNFVNTLLNAAWMFAAIIFHFHVVFLFGIYIAVGLLDFAIYHYYFRKLARAEFVLDRPLMRQMLWYGVPFAFISGFEMVVAKVDVVIQKFFLPFHGIGLYSTAYKLIDALNFIPAIVAVSLFPYFAKFKDLRTDEVRQAVNGLNRYLVALALPMGVGGSILGRKIILTVFHEPFAGAALPFQILIWAMVATYLYAVPNIMMIAKQVRRSIYILAALVVFNAVLNIIFVPRYGIIASAWLTVATYALYALAYTVYARKLLDFDLLRFLPMPLLASSAMAVALYFLRDLHLVILIVIGGATYVSVLLAAGYFRNEDWLFFKSIFKPGSPPPPGLRPAGAGPRG